MEKYEKTIISNTRNLKDNTIYFFLKNQNFSEHQIKNLRKNNFSFILNGKSCNINEKIFDGDILKILKNPSKPSNILKCDGKLDIIFEDDDFLIVNKPHMLACIPTRSHINDNLGGRIVSYMQGRQDNFVLRIVNRLDKDTAGIVIIAKSTSAYNNLRNINKTYYALCKGNFNDSKFTIDAPILTMTENGINQMKRVVSNQGKPSITHAYVEKQYHGYALLKLKLETGRTHQIRVHLSHIGHSLIGDNIYTQTSESEPHTFLILKEISFLHPKTQQVISLGIPFPKVWEKYIDHENI